MGGRHGRMARGGHGLPKVSLGPAMSYLSTPCGRATPETVLQVFYTFGYPTPYAYGGRLAVVTGLMMVL
jgi:hypothetical protein